MPEEITVRPALDWEEVYRGAIGAGKAFSGRSVDEPFFFDRTVNAPTLPLENTHLVLIDDEIVGQLQIYERQIFLNGRVTWTGAIGNVYTLPKYQKQGFGRQLLDFSEAFMSDNGYSFSILLTESGLQEFYGQAGWQSLRYAKYNVRPEPANRTATDKFTEFTLGEHLDRVSDIHRSTYAAVDGAVSRSKHYWKEWILNPEYEIITDTDQVVLYLEDGTVEGYLVWEEEDDGVSCLELGFDGEQERNFLIACWEFLAAKADGGAVVWYPQIPDLLVDEFDPDVEETHIAGTMVQLHNAKEVSQLVDEPIRTTDDLVTHLSNGGFYWSPLDAF